MTNTFGTRFRVTTWGESHGSALGAVIDGCPAGLELSAEDVARELQRDVPEPRVGTGRIEPNLPEILSGVFEGRTIGTPISILVLNVDVGSERYKVLKNTPRPGHADFTYRARWGHVDWRGGSRASGRECIGRLAAGAVARKLLDLAGISVESELLEMAGMPIRDTGSLEAAIRRVEELALQGRSTGGRVQVRARGVPAGLGEPVFGKLSAELASAMFGIGSVKAFELGAGCQHAGLTGEESNDELGLAGGSPTFLSNRAGGVLGGITNGMDLVGVLTVKPTPSIPLEQRTVDLEAGTETRIRIEGRFDANITPRVAVVAESMLALLLTDHMLRSGLLDPTQVDRSACMAGKRELPADPTSISRAATARRGTAGGRVKTGALAPAVRAGRNRAERTSE